LADYRDQYRAIQAAGASVIAISVDPPEQSEPMRRALRLEFPILCDTNRDVVRAWDLYNAGERGGIAVPATFIIDTDRRVRYASVETMFSRATIADVLRALRSAHGQPSVECHRVVPRIREWVRSLRYHLKA